MNRFKLTKEGKQTLKVETPEPIPNSFWGYLGLWMFQNIDSEDKLTFRLLYRDIEYESIEERKIGAGVFQIRENSRPFNFTYGYIYDGLYGQPPDEARIGLNTGTIGPLYVPDGRGHYIDKIIEKFEGDKALEKIEGYKNTLRNIKPRLFDFFYSNKSRFGNTKWGDILGKVRTDIGKKLNLPIKLQVKCTPKTFYFPTAFDGTDLGTYFANEFILQLDSEMAKINPSRDLNKRLGKDNLENELYNLDKKYSSNLGTLL